MSSLSYIFAPCGDERRFDKCLEKLLCSIGSKYGTIGKKDRIRGIKYIVSCVNNGKTGHIKKMIRSYKKQIRFQDDDQFFFKIHRNNYSKYVIEIMKLINLDEELKNIVRTFYNPSMAKDSVKETYDSLNKVMINSNNAKDKDNAASLVRQIDSNDYRL